MTGTPTLAYDIVKRNGSSLTSPVDTDWGLFVAGASFDVSDPLTWDRLLIHPYEDEDLTFNRSASPYNTDYYDIELSATPNTTRGKEYIKRSYGVWNTGNGEYDYTLEDISEVVWVDDVISHQIDVDVDLLDRTAHTFVMTIQGSSADFVDGDTALHDYKPVLVQVMPTVKPQSTSNLTIVEKLHEVTPDTLKYSAPINTTCSIDFQINHAMCNGSADTMGIGAWVWSDAFGVLDYKNLWYASTLNASSSGIDIPSQSTGTTRSYYFDLFIYKGLRSGFDANDSSFDDARTLSFDRRITVIIEFS